MLTRSLHNHEAGSIYSLFIWVLELKWRLSTSWIQKPVFSKAKTSDPRGDLWLQAERTRSHPPSASRHILYYYSPIHRQSRDIIKQYIDKLNIWIVEVWIVEYVYYQLRHGPVETPPTPPLYLHLPDGSGGLDRGICRLPTLHPLCGIHCVVTVL